MLECGMMINDQQPIFALRPRVYGNFVQRRVPGKPLATPRGGRVSELQCGGTWVVIPSKNQASAFALGLLCAPRAAVLVGSGTWPALTL